MQKIPIPPKEKLEDMLFTQKMSKKKIARYFVVSKPTVSSWMKHYDLIGKIPTELLVEKRRRTNAKKMQAKNFLERALDGEKIRVPGFNSEFTEDYLMEKTYEREKELEAVYAEIEAKREAKKK